MKTKNEKWTVFRFPFFMKMKNNEGIKNLKKNSFKHENGSQIFEFRFSYWSKNKI